MSENGNGQSATPAYAPWKSFKGFIEELAPKGLPQRIDYTVMPNRSGATQSALRVALAFLGLTVGDVPTDSMKELLASYGNDDEWKKTLRKIVVDAYAPLTQDLSIDHGTAQQLAECFRNRGNVKGSTLTRAVRFYLSALSEAGISYSQYFKAPPAPRKRAPKSKTKPDQTTNDSAVPPGKVQEKRSSGGKSAAADRRVESEWPVHSFLVPTRQHPIRVEAPKDLTRAEWRLIDAFVQGTIELTEKKSPSPSGRTEGEG